jgi:acyl-CoA thioester hydrolase, YbgC/YbaW family
MTIKRFNPKAIDESGKFVRDTVTNLVWHRVQTRPLYADTDRSQVVYHANYLRYFELGRASLMRDMGYPYREVENAGFIYPVVDLQISFKNPLFYDDPIWIHTRPAEIDRIRVTFNYLITQVEHGCLVCTGFTKHCALNEKRKPTSVDATTVRLWKTFPA